MAEGFNTDYKKRKLNQDSEEQENFTKEQIFQLIHESINKRMNEKMQELQQIQLQGPTSGDLITHVKSYDRDLSNNDLIEIKDGSDIVLIPYYDKLNIEDHSHLKEKISELKETWSGYLFNQQTKEINVVPVFNSKGEQTRTRPLNECFHQHPIFEDIMLDLMKISSPSCQLDIYNYSAYQGRDNRPDFIFVKKDWPLTSAFCSFAVELQLGEIDKEHLGRIKSYNKHVLESAPMRSFIISAVSNLEEMVLFKTNRTADGAIKHTRYFFVDFWTRGIELLHYMINEPQFVGFNHGSLAFNLKIGSKTHYITSILGRGRTACVFRFQPYSDAIKFEPSNYAVKVFQDESYYERDKELNNELTKRFEELKKSESIDGQLESNKTSDMFIYQVACIDSHNAIVYQPVGVKLGLLTPRKIEQIFKAVRSLHRLGIIHRDLSPNHFYQFGDKILIIDFGCAVFVEKNTTTTVSRYRGSIHFAAREILEYLCEKKGDYKPQRWHDLESVIRSLMFIYHELTMPKMPDCTSETVKDVTNRVIMYWELVDQHLDKLMNRFWTEALEIVRVQNDDDDDEEEIFDVHLKLEKHFEKFPNRYAKNQAILDEFNKINKS